MKMSAKGLAFLREAEGCKLKAYKDGGGVWTIGVGHTEGVKPGQTITQFEADEMLAMDLEEREDELNAILKGVPTRQCEFDALLSLAFNIGFGDPNHKPKPIPGLKTSTVLKRHKLGNRIGAANAFLMWNKDNGKVVPGLMARRERERALYLSDEPKPAVIKPVPPVAPAPPAPVAPTPTPPPAGCLAALLGIFSK